MSGGRRRADVQLDVVEVAHAPHREQRGLDLVLVVGVAHLERQHRADGLGLHAPVALHVDGADHAGVGHRGGGLRGGLACGDAGRLSQLLACRRRRRGARLAGSGRFLLSRRRPPAGAAGGGKGLRGAHLAGTGAGCCARAAVARRVRVARREAPSHGGDEARRLAGFPRRDNEKGGRETRAAVSIFPPAPDKNSQASTIAGTGSACPSCSFAAPIAAAQLSSRGAGARGAFLKWVGGKTSLLPELLKHVPARLRRYHEPFLGGGALFFAVAPRRARSATATPSCPLLPPGPRRRLRVLDALARHVYEKAHFAAVRELDPMLLSPPRARPASSSSTRPASTASGA